MRICSDAAGIAHGIDGAGLTAFRGALAFFSIPCARISFSQQRQMR